MKKYYDGLIIENEPFDDSTISDFVYTMDVINDNYAAIYDYYSLTIIYVFEKQNDALDVMKLICERTEYEFPTLAVRHNKMSFIYNFETREIEKVN